jgi:hypothetical protein
MTLSEQYIFHSVGRKRCVVYDKVMVVIIEGKYFYGRIDENRSKIDRYRVRDSH